MLNKTKDKLKAGEIVIGPLTGSMDEQLIEALGWSGASPRPDPPRLSLPSHSVGRFHRPERKEACRAGAQQWMKESRITAGFFAHEALIYGQKEEHKMALKEKSLSMVAVFLVLLCSFSLAGAQNYPTRPITSIVLFAPGSSTDIIARRMAEEASKALGQPVVCLNKTGGSGTVGVAETLRSKPDGYTIGWVSTPTLAIIPHMQNLPYDPLRDMAHICVVSPYEWGIYVRGDAPWNSLKDLVDYARSNPGKVVYASSGSGTLTHIIMVRIGQQNHLNWKHVPYRGDGEIIPAILGGHVHAAVGSPAALVPQSKAGKIKVLVVTSKDHWPYLPSIPTLLESGYNFYQAGYLSLGAPAGIPEAVRQKLEDTFHKIIQDPAINDDFQKNLYAKLEYQSGADYAKYIKEQYFFYKDFIKLHGIKP